MRVLSYGLFCGCFLMFISGCTTNRWTIHQTEISATVNNDNKNQASNSILLDKQTGDTWLLWPNENGYKWLKLSRQQNSKCKVK